MACLYLNHNKIITNITSYQTQQKVTYYNVDVQVGDVQWVVQRRYNEFLQLHNVLVREHSIIKDLFPPKKFIGATNPSFIEKRRLELNEYLNTIVPFLENSLPSQLIEFLELNKYDINLILKEFSSFCYQQGDSCLEKSNYSFAFNPLQLHAISKRLKQECPVEEAINQENDFCHVLEFCANMKTLIIKGNPGRIGKSNLDYNDLTIELEMFKNLETLLMFNVNITKITSLGNLRNTLKGLVCKSSYIKSPCEILLCDQVHKSIPTSTSSDTVCLYTWNHLIKLDLTENQIAKFDNSMSLCPNLEILNFTSNRIETISHLNSCKKIKKINLSQNNIKLLSNLHKELNTLPLTELILYENRLTSLNGLNYFSNLQSLDINSNFISDLEEIINISKLNKLINLNLSGNPVATVIDYRIKVLQLLYTRINYIVLDNEKPSEVEISCASVRNTLVMTKKLQNKK